MFTYKKTLTSNHSLQINGKLLNTLYNEAQTTTITLFLLFFYMQTYIIAHYNPSVRIIDLPLMLCVFIVYISGGDLQFNVDSEQQIFWETCHGNFILRLRVFAGNPPRGNRRRIPFCILFWCLAWGSNPFFTSNKPTHYLLDYSDFIVFLTLRNIKKGTR